jgi:membrane protein|tara:strand:- start:6639 stop:7904 length:1266 start_codon:yes stop_codon:yes gene_type:complete
MAEALQTFRKRLTVTGRFAYYLWGQFSLDDCKDTAAALTYQTMFALVPLLTVFYILIAAVPASRGWVSQIEDYIFTNFIPETAETGALIQQYLHDFSQQARNLTGVGVLFLAVTSYLMLSTVERALNEIWRVKEVRKGLQRLLLYWAVLSMVPLLAGFALAITTLIFSLPLIEGMATTAAFVRVFAFVPWILSIVVFTLIFSAVPNCRVPIKHALTGGVITALVFGIAKNLFTTVMSMGSWQVIYGAFVAVPLFLLWIYLSWNILLGGAELVRALSVYEDDETVAAEPHLFQILSILESFYRAHLSGVVLTERRIFEGAARISHGNWSEYRALLLDLNIIQPVDGGGYVLSQDLGNISLWDFYSSLPWPLPERGILLDTYWKKDLSRLLQSVTDHSKANLDLSLVSLFRKEEPVGKNMAAG